MRAPRGGGRERHGSALTTEAARTLPTPPSRTAEYESPAGPFVVEDPYDEQDGPIDLAAAPTITPQQFEQLWISLSSE